LAKQERRIDLIDEDLDAVGCFLEFLYTGDYFPRKIPGSRDLERDPSTPLVDETGDQLLKHARVYTLGDTLSLPALKSLASSKIHCVNSTAKGEIAYARYVYAHTQKDDTTIRAPVANFWATRSHTLRSEAEDEFRSMCLEFPQFGYDVLSELHLYFTPFLVLHGYVLMVTSSGFGREAQEGEEREAASYAWEFSQACAWNLINLRCFWSARKGRALWSRGKGCSTWLSGCCTNTSFATPLCGIFDGT
jgi:hypothetical protein